MLKNKYLSLILILALTFSASLIGSIVTSTFKEPWYSTIILPSFNPPSWVFGPVWTTLYLMMTLAIWLFWQSNKPGDGFSWRKINQTQALNIRKQTTHNFNVRTVVYQKV